MYDRYWCRCTYIDIINEEICSLSQVNVHKTGTEDKVLQKNVTNRTWTEQNRWQTRLLGILRRYGVISWELIWLFWQSFFFWKQPFLRKGSLYLWPEVRQIKCWESGWCGSCVIVSGLRSRDEVIQSKLGVEMAINSLVRWVILRNSFFLVKTDDFSIKELSQ